MAHSCAAILCGAEYIHTRGSTSVVQGQLKSQTRFHCRREGDTLNSRARTDDAPSTKRLEIDELGFGTGPFIRTGIRLPWTGAAPLPALDGLPATEASKPPSVGMNLVQRGVEADPADGCAFFPL